MSVESALTDPGIHIGCMTAAAATHTAPARLLQAQLAHTARGARAEK